MHWYSSSKSSPGHNQIGVYDDVKQIFKMAPTPRKTKNVTSRLFATPRSVFFPQYFESCDLRQWGISDVKKNGVRWTFVRSLELKRPNTRVFLLNNLPDKVQKNLNKDVRFWYLEIFFFEIYLLMVVSLVKCKAFSHSAVLLLKMQQWVLP